MIFSFLSFIIRLAVDVYTLAIVVYCILTWFPQQSGTIAYIRSVLGAFVNPYLNLFRKIIPPAGGVDFSPIIALLVLQLVARILF